MLFVTKVKWRREWRVKSHFIASHFGSASLCCFVLMIIMHLHNFDAKIWVRLVSFIVLNISDGKTV